MTEPSDSQAMRARPVVVLGMHKSGTTLIADTLHRSGIAMVGAEAAGGYDDGNKMERVETRALNMDLLGDDGIESIRLLHSVTTDAATATHLAQARSLIDGLAPGPWGFKDPRTLLTFGLWDKVLDDPLLIGVFRNPVEVFGHYVRRAGRKWISRDPAYLPDALRAWCVYNQHLLDLKHKHPQLLLLDYSEFMTTDMGMQHLSAHVGCSLVDCRKQTMRRAEARVTTDYRLARLVVRLRDGLNPDRIQDQLQHAKT